MPPKKACFLTTPYRSKHTSRYLEPYDLEALPKHNAFRPRIFPEGLLISKLSPIGVAVLFREKEIVFPLFSGARQP
jgi:hypothetical protein